MLCEFEEHSQSPTEKSSEEQEENFTRHAPQSMQQDIFLYCCVPSLLCTCAWRDACVSVCVCAPLCIIISLVQSFATFRFVSFRLVWFGFVLVFVFMLLFFRLPSLRHSSIIHIDFFCFSPLPTPLSSALLMFLVFRCPKMFLLIFLYIFCVLCYLLFVGFACDSHVNNWQNSTGKCTKKSRAFVEVMVRNGAYQWLKEVKTGWPFRSNLSFILLRSLWEFSRVAFTTVEL